MQIALPKASSAIQFLLIAALPMGMATAADFTITGTSTAAQSIGKNDTGTVAVGASLNTTAEVAVTFTGENRFADRQASY